LLLIGLFYYLEDGGNTFFRKSLNFYQTTRRYISEDITVYSQRSENLKSKKFKTMNEEHGESLGLDKRGDPSVKWLH
jgi:hypothetical protein